MDKRGVNVSGLSAQNPQKAVKLAALQMNAVLGDRKANFEKIERLAKGVEADFLILPEVFAVGWCPEIFAQNADTNNETLDFLSGLAKKLNVNIIGGSFIEERVKRKEPVSSFLYNTCPVFNRRGELVAKYDKMHLFSADGEDKYLTAGEMPVMVEIEGLKIGLSVCYDIRFPEIYRTYAQAGADIVVNVAAWGAHKPGPWEVMTCSRAAENQLYIAAVTQSGQIKGDAWNLGRSRIIDYKGDVISEITDQREGVFYATIDLDEMHEFRRKFSVLNDIKKSYEVKKL
jgi:predicted amidohydrolase